MRASLLTAAAVLALAVPAAYGQTPVVDATGTWSLTFQTDQGPMAGRLVLKKDGEKLAGTISSDQGGTIAVEAEIDGKTLSAWFNYPGQSGPMPVQMTGTIDGDTVKGSFTLSGSAGGAFGGTRETNPPQAAPSAPSMASLTGTWGVTLQLDTMTANPTLTLKQDGDKLTGEYASEQYGKFPVTGSVSGSDVTLSFSMSVEGNALTVTYKGTLGSDGTLKGTANYGDMMSGTFTASRKA